MKAKLLYQLGVAAILTLCSNVTHAQVSGKAKSDSSSGEAAAGAPTTSGIEQNVKALQDSIKKATDRLQSAGKSSSEKVKELENVANTVQTALKEVSPNGGLYSELKRNIDATEAKMKVYHEKAIAPNLSSETQLKYRGLENRLAKLKDDLYKGMIALDAQRIDLEKTLQDVKENKELVADLLAANDLEEANKAVLEVVGNMGNLNKSFDGLLKNITKASVPEKTQ
jgi:chromosome segregation ATPase